MRFVIRVKFAVVLSVTLVIFAGSAWAADETVVAGIINTYGFTTAVAGSTVTVTGSKTITGSDSALIIGALDPGVVIDWRADFTANNWNRPNKDTGMINFSGDGEFKLTAGTIQITNRTDWVTMIMAGDGNNDNVTVTVNGGKIEGTMAGIGGIEAWQGIVNINGGEINMPSGNAITAEIVNGATPAVIKNGLVFGGYTGTIYGHVVSVPDSEHFADKYQPGDFMP